MRLAIHIISTFLFCLPLLFSYFCSRKSAGFPFTSFILFISTIYWYKNQLFFRLHHLLYTEYIYSTSYWQRQSAVFLLHLLFYTGYIYGLLVKNPLFFTLYRVYLLATHLAFSTSLMSITQVYSPPGGTIPKEHLKPPSNGQAFFDKNAYMWWKSTFE